MVEPNEATPPPAAPAASPPATTAPPLAAPPPAAPELPNVGEPGWLKARTERAKEDGRKESRKELKAERKAAKAAAQEALAAKGVAEAQVEAANRAADAILAQVPESERKALLAQAGNDAAKKLELFAAWQLAKGSVQQAPTAPAPAPAPAPQPAPASPPAATAAAQPLAPPATSAAPPAAPPPPSPGAGEDKRATYEQLRNTNPYLASQYLLNHQEEIYKPRTFDQVPKRPQ